MAETDDEATLTHERALSLLVLRVERRQTMQHSIASIKPVKRQGGLEKVRGAAICNRLSVRNRDNKGFLTGERKQTHAPDVMLQHLQAAPMIVASAQNL